MRLVHNSLHDEVADGLRAGGETKRRGAEIDHAGLLGGFLDADDVGQRALPAVLVGHRGDLELRDVHVLRAALVDRAGAVAEHDVAACHTCQQLGSADKARLGFGRVYMDVCLPSRASSSLSCSTASLAPSSRSRGTKRV